MTAIQLIADIFSRVQPGVQANKRVISRKQLDYVRNLIAEEGISSEAHPGMNGSLVWMPQGRDKFIINEDRIGDPPRHTITKLSNLVESKSGSLFDQSQPSNS